MNTFMLCSLSLIQIDLRTYKLR